MHALVTGSSGFIGRALVAEVRRRGHGVRRAVRRRAQQDADREVTEVGELSGSTDWSEALRGVDTVFHLAARVHQVGERGADFASTYRRANVEATASLARAAIAAGARRFVFVSSVKVMGDSSAGRPFEECDPPQPRDPYGHSKLDAELALDELSKQIDVITIRPPLVYGPDVRANFLSLLKLAASGMPLPLRAARAGRSWVFIDNLIDALIACASLPHVSAATYFVSDGHDLSVAELIGQLRAELGMSPRLWVLPEPVVNAAARLLGRADAAQRLFAPLQVSIGLIRRELGWSPPVTVQEGLRTTLRWYVGEHSTREI